MEQTQGIIPPSWNAPDAARSSSYSAGQAEPSPSSPQLGAKGRREKPSLGRESNCPGEQGKELLLPPLSQVCCHQQPRLGCWSLSQQQQPRLGILGASKRGLKWRLPFLSSKRERKNPKIFLSHLSCKEKLQVMCVGSLG